MKMVILGASVGAVIGMFFAGGEAVKWGIIGAAIGFFLTLTGAKLDGKE